MRLIPRPVYERNIEAAAPFSLDTLNRENIARNLTRLFKVSADGLVVALNGKWGEGKTSFIKFWNTSLVQDPDMIPIYYDAFKYDFTGDAFVSIAASIHKGLEKQLKQGVTARETQAQLGHLKKASKELAIDLAKMTAGLAVSSFTGGLINSERVSDFAKQAFDRVTFGTLEVNADEQFEAYLRSQDSVEAYQTKLKELIDPAGARHDMKMVIFVDELDRCRPLFAVEILEKVKHFFNVPGVFFVLSINKDQLLRTISNVYGLGEEAAIYLQKFVDLEVRLPSIEDMVLLSDSELTRYVRGVAQELDLAEGPVAITSELGIFVKLLKDPLKLNARGIEKAISLMALGLGSCSEEEAVRLKSYIVTAALIRVGYPEYYDSLRREGTFRYGGGDQRDSPIFEWAKNRFARERADQASNVFNVPQIGEACRLLDLYEVPGSASSKTQ